MDKDQRQPGPGKRPRQGWLRRLFDPRPPIEPWRREGLSEEEWLETWTVR